MPDLKPPRLQAPATLGGGGEGVSERIEHGTHLIVERAEDERCADGDHTREQRVFDEILPGFILHKSENYRIDAHFGVSCLLRGHGGEASVIQPAEARPACCLRY